MVQKVDVHPARGNKRCRRIRASTAQTGQRVGVASGIADGKCGWAVRREYDSGIAMRMCELHHSTV